MVGSGRVAAGEHETVRFRQVTTDHDRRGSATMSIINVEHALRFEIHTPRTLIPSYRVIQWDGRDKLAREVSPPRLVEREDDAPIVEAIDAVLGHKVRGELAALPRPVSKHCAVNDGTIAPEGFVASGRGRWTPPQSVCPKSRQ